MAADQEPNLIVQRFGLTFTEPGHDFVMDVTSDQKPATFLMKEGVEYRMKLHFKIEREIVSGLRLHTVVTRKGITIEKMSYMIGTYDPRFHEFISTTPEEAPKGMMALGHYVANSKVVDDDKNVHAQWEWTFDVKKDWN